MLLLKKTITHNINYPDLKYILRKKTYSLGAKCQFFRPYASYTLGPETFSKKIKKLVLPRNLQRLELSTSKNSKPILPQNKFYSFIRTCKESFKNKKDTLIQNFIKNAKNEQKHFLFFYFVSLAIWVSLMVQDFKILGALAFTVLFLFLFFILMKRIENKIKKQFSELSNKKVFLILAAVITFGILIYFKRYFSLGLYLLCLSAYLAINSKYFSQQISKNFNAIIYDNQVVNFHFNKEFQKFQTLREFNNIVGLFYCYSQIYKYSDLFFVCHEHADLFVTVQSLILMFCLLNLLLIHCVRWIILGHCNPIPEVLLKSKAITLASATVTCGIALGTYCGWCIEHPEWSFLVGKGLIQSWTYGFTYSTISELNTYRDFVSCMGRGATPPLKPDGSLDLAIINEALSRAQVQEHINMMKAMQAETALESNLLLHRLQTIQYQFPEKTTELDQLYKQRQLLVESLREVDMDLDAKIQELEKLRLHEEN